MKLTLPLLPISIAVLGYACFASQKSSAPEINFGRDIRPILSEHCFKCHGPNAGAGSAGLRLDSFEGATAQLDDGSAIVAGKPDDSVLLKRVSQTNPAMRMPPPG